MKRSIIFCTLFLGSLSIAQVPKPGVVPIAMTSVSGSMSCASGATLTVSAELSGGSLGGGGKLNVTSLDGVKLGSLDVSIAANKKASFEVKTSFSGCSKSNNVFQVDFVPGGSGTTSTRFIEPGVLSFKEAVVPP